MFSDKEALATIAVRSTQEARKFYEGKLGLRPAGPNQPGVLSYKTGPSTILVYESRFAGTNQATAVTWVADDVEGVVKALNGKGIQFEHYEFPDITRRGDVHVMGTTPGRVVQGSGWKHPQCGQPVAPARRQSMGNPFVHVELNTTECKEGEGLSTGKLFDWKLEDVPMQRFHLHDGRGR